MSGCSCRGSSKAGRPAERTNERTNKPREKKRREERSYVRSFKTRPECLLERRVRYSSSSRREKKRVDSLRSVRRNGILVDEQRSL